MRAIETYRESCKVRNLYTDGGFYSESDMKRSKSEGGLGFSQKLGKITIVEHETTCLYLTQL